MGQLFFVEMHYFSAMRLMLPLLLCFTALLSWGKVQDTLYINTGVVEDKKRPVPFKLFNTTPTFDSLDAFVQLPLGDTLELVLINTDTTDHDLVLASVMAPIAVASGQSTTISFVGREKGVFRLFSAEESWRMLGLATAILVAAPQEKHFIWHLRDAEGALNRQVQPGTSFDPTTYLPDYFSINALRFPRTTTDSLGYVTGQVGDTLYINIINAGFMDHSIHFHGYHVILEASNYNNPQIGWDKDTFPVLPGEWIRVRLVPHQPGKFPVHDHNLVAVTSGGNYPGGMIAILDIAP